MSRAKRRRRLRSLFRARKQTGDVPLVERLEARVRLPDGGDVVEPMRADHEVGLGVETLETVASSHR